MKNKAQKWLKDRFELKRCTTLATYTTCTKMQDRIVEIGVVIMNSIYSSERTDLEIRNKTEMRFDRVSRICRVMQTSYVPQ